MIDARLLQQSSFSARLPGWPGMALAALVRRPADIRHDAAGEGTTRSEIAAFEFFFQQYEARITNYLWRMVGEDALAADLSQETFIRAWEHFAEVQALDRPLAWLFRVATNLALNALRRATTRVGSATPLEGSDPAGSDPSVRFVERDFIQEILAALPPKARALLILREVYDLDVAEIAQMLGLSHAATKMALSRARVQFRERYLRQEGR
jgi:RNA polymerase sigma factor (sigma-70 family)